MAEKFIRASGGNDSSSGDDFDNGWATIEKIYTYLNASGAKGDIFNLVNDAVHTMPALPQVQVTKSLIGTDYDTDPSFTIRGTDSSGNPAITTVQASVANSYFMHPRTNVRYVSIQGLFLDMSSMTATDDMYLVRSIDDLSGPVRFQACRIRGHADNAANYGEGRRSIFDDAATAVGPSNWGEISYCVIENCPRPVDWVEFTTQWQGVAHHNVIWIKNLGVTTEELRWLYTLPAIATNNAGFYSNTIYYDFQDTTGTIPALISGGAASGNMGTVNWHSNAIWTNSPSSAGTVYTEIFEGSAGSTATFSGDVRNNVIQFGPDVVAGDVGTIYQVPWIGGLDAIGYEVAASTLFNDPDTAYTWENVNGTGYDLTVPADLRLKLHKTGGLFGSLPGALPLLSAEEGGDDDDTDEGGGDPDDPRTNPYVDVRPFYADILEYNLNARCSTDRNRSRKHYLRRDREEKGFREWTGRRIPLGTSTTKRIYSGIETAEVIMMEADSPVALNAGPVENVYLPAAEMVLVAGGEYSFIKIQNTSSTDTANTLLMAAD